MRSGELTLAIEIPPGFARDVLRGGSVQVGAWFDGAMPTRAETVRGYLQGIHQHWLTEQARERLGVTPAGLIDIQTRFRYNPDVRSLPARSEEHTSELQSQSNLVCRLLLEKKKKKNTTTI